MPAHVKALTQHLLWIALWAFFASVVLFACLMGLNLYSVYHPKPDELGWCDDFLSHPVRLILNVGVPLGFCASAGLAVLSGIGVGAKRRVLAAVSIATILIVALLILRWWLRSSLLPGSDLSAWWMF